jgi:hypothetical protein
MIMIRLDAWELDQLLLKAGFVDPEHRRTAWGVAMRESRGTVDIIGGPNGNGTYDYGLFQFNQIHKNNIPEWDSILDGLTNAKVAFRWTKGTDWSNWGLGDSGWAGYVKRTNFTVWQRMQDDFKEFYDLYPSAVAAAKALSTATAVKMANLVPGRRNDDILVYQRSLRKFLGSTLAAKLNPSGATGYYGGETRAMTKAAYEKVSRLTGSTAWLKGDLTVPGAGLVKRLGLRPV